MSSSHFMSEETGTMSRESSAAGHAMESTPQSYTCFGESQAADAALMAPIDNMQPADNGSSSGSSPQQRVAEPRHVDPSSNSPPSLAPVTRRNRSATTMMTFRKNQDPNSPPQVVSSPTSLGTPSPQRQRSLFTVGSVQIKSSSIVDVISKVTSDTETQSLLDTLYHVPPPAGVAQDSGCPSSTQSFLATPTSCVPSSSLASTGASASAAVPEVPVKKLPKQPVVATSLPPELKLPMALRCDFCQKFDSVCSQCHFKWRGIAESRKAVFATNFHALSEHRKLPLLFLTAAYGHVGAIVSIVDALTGNSGAAVNGVLPATAPGATLSPAVRLLSEWQAPFVPVAIPPLCTTLTDADLPSLAETFRRAGTVSLLHVACGMQRLDIAKCLLERGCRLRRSQHRLTPLDMLPYPLPEAWSDMLSTFDIYEEFTMVERARRLRTNGDFEGALLEYNAAIQRNSASESARCGIAKTYYDQGNLTECIRSCESILHDVGGIQWLELTPECVTLLRDAAERALHEKAHQDHCTALRACGCVIVDERHHAISLRKLKFRIIVDRILPFCNCSDLWGLWQATRIPMLQSAVERVASKGPLETVATMLTGEFGYAEMYEAIRADAPPTEGRHAILKAPLRFLGVQVAVMADFHTFLMKASVVGGNPKYSPDSFFTFGKKNEDSKRARIVATKCFRVYRAGVGKAWEVGDGGEWEIDLPASDALLNAVQERLATARR